MSGGTATPAMMMLGSALLGGGISAGLTEAIDLSDDGHVNGGLKTYAGSYAGGFVMGGLMPEANIAGSGLKSVAQKEVVKTA